jgi:tetratricopeptide (TPR) repeat protein
MSDSPSTTAASDSQERQPDREARIEQLLLSGLDHYFAGQHEQAINVWTRVVFLERGHARARAYIERARRALAERQRESDELLHRGVVAFDRGDTEVALGLVTKAIEQIGPDDVASALLDRLLRLRGGAGVVQETVSPPGVAAPRQVESPVRPSRPAWYPVLMGAAVLVTGAAVVVGVLFVQAWRADTLVPAARALAATEDPLPVVGGLDREFERVQELLIAGRLDDAVAALDGINLLEPEHPEATALRAEVQRRLLELRSSPGLAPASSQ